MPEPVASVQVERLTAPRSAPEQSSSTSGKPKTMKADASDAALPGFSRIASSVMRGACKVAKWL